MLRAHDDAETGKPGDTARKSVLSALAATTGRNAGDRAAWGKWLTATHPAAAATIARAGIDWPAWQQRLARIDWNAGDANRGGALFRSLSCQGCHAGGGALGPNLAGLGKRFGREDRFRAIVDPSREVPARYRATALRTKAGRTLLGMIVYEAADGLLLQTGPDGIVRIDAADLEERQPARRSLMPERLLDRAGDADLADLDAYLRAVP